MPGRFRNRWFAAAASVFAVLSGPAPAEEASRASGRGWISLPSVSQIALLEVEGAIYDSRFLIRQIRRFGRNPLVRAMVLRIDSPGGEVGAVQEIVAELFRFRDGREVVRPIVASFGGVAASGGYYLACAADHILSNPGALTGSIGVIMEFPDAESLLKKLGVRYVVVKSGRYKDTGSFSRRISDDELAVLQATIDDVYEQFLEAVWESRKEAVRAAAAAGAGEPPSSIGDGEAMTFLRGVADGRIMSGRQALEWGLVDGLGNLEDAIDKAVSLCGAKGRHVIAGERRRRDPSWMDFIGGMLGWTREGEPSARQDRVTLQYLLR